MTPKGEQFRSWAKSAIAFNFKPGGRHGDTNSKVSVAHVSSPVDPLSDQSVQGNEDHRDVDSKVEELRERANSLVTKFKQGSKPSHIDGAIVLVHEALELYPPGHPKRSDPLSWLADDLYVRYQEFGAIDDLRKAIGTVREALTLCPLDHPDRSSSLNNLSTYVHARYRKYGYMDDLNEAIDIGRKSLTLRPVGHPRRSKSLRNLSVYVCDRYEELGDIGDLKESIILGREVLERYPIGHEDHSNSLSDLRCCLNIWSTKLAGIDNLNKLMDLHCEAPISWPLAGRPDDDEILGRSFDGPQIAAERGLYEALISTGCVQVATQIPAILKTFGASEVVPDWVSSIQKKCTDMLEMLGDTSFNCGEHSKAITHYSSVLSLSPSNATDILLKRARARAAKGLWEDALADADEVIKLDSSLHRGYQMKYSVLHSAKRYPIATNTTLSPIECSLDKDVRELRTYHHSPQGAITDIDTAISTIFNLCPLVLIDLTTGQLCGAEERIRIFKSEALFKELVSEAVAEKMEPMHILETVRKYFQWVMFSHRWEGKEPTFKDVNSVESVWKLGQSPLNEKLRKFCTTALENGYRWVWSDTCCIDRDTSAILSQSLTSMYTWYAEAAATFVYLVDVPPGSELGALTNSQWMTRAWTLQELLASKVVRFYDQTWKPYLLDMSANHKQSPAIKEELAHAIGVAPEAITSFRPEHLGVREKLRLASTRHALVEEDLAYSLIGIFSSNIAPRYGLGKAALGQLLENVVVHSGDITVIAWAGEPSPYNSALPSSLVVYAHTPYRPSPMESGDLCRLVEQLKTQVLRKDALDFYARVVEFPRTTFTDRCLRLPCIIFSVTKIGVRELSATDGHLYRASVSYLGKVMFRTCDLLPLALPRKLVFVHPWIQDLRDPPDHSVWDDEPEDESTSNSDDDTDSSSDSGSDDWADAMNDIPTSPSLSPAEPSPRPDRCTQALRLIARLGRPFNALLLEQQSNGQYKRVAAENEIIVPGVSYKTNLNLNNLKASVLEIV